MKTSLLLLAFVATLTACTSNGDGSNENEDSVELGESYGPAKVDIEKAISVVDMLADYADKTEETEYTFEGVIQEVCSKAGCWVNIDKGNGETFMVRFKDHFTIPTETAVNTGAYIHGIAYWDTVSVEMLQHFAEDAGKSQEEIDAIKEPKFELGFEADAITLKK